MNTSTEKSTIRARRRSSRPVGIARIAGVLLALGGGAVACQPTKTSAPPSTVVATARPVAIVDGRRITMADLESALLERAGGEVLREQALDRAVAREAALRELVIDDEAVRRERAIVLANLSDDPDRAERLLADLRADRGLGPSRFAALLRRTATLRALVAEDVVLEDALIESAWDAMHGEKRISRVIAVEDLRAAETARRRVASGEPFGLVAAEISVDPSAVRGGRLPAVSRLDPAWPEAFRTVLFELEPGATSQPVGVDGRFLVMEVVETIPPSGTDLAEGRDEAVATARLAVESLLMERLARRLVPDAFLDPLHPALRWSVEGGP